MTAELQELAGRAQDVQRRISALESEYEEVVRAAFPVGSTHHYMHGKQVRWVQVLGVHRDRMSVTGATGTTYELDAAELFSYLRKCAK